MNHPTGQAFLQYATHKLEENLVQIERCAGLLSDVQLWAHPNDNTNSVGNLILHLTGNVRQWVIAGLGGETFERDRPAEFAPQSSASRDHIVAELNDAVTHATRALERIDPLRLHETRTIQRYEVAVVTAVFHVVEHFSFHTGQIIHATKSMRDVDLSLYDEQGQRRDGGRDAP